LKKVGIILPEKTNPELRNLIRFIQSSANNIVFLNPSTGFNEEDPSEFFQRRDMNGLEGTLSKHLRRFIIRQKTYLALGRELKSSKNSWRLAKKFISFVRDYLRIGVSFDFFLRATTTKVFKRRLELDYLVYFPSTLINFNTLRFALQQKINIICWFYSWDNIYKCIDILNCASHYVVWNGKLRGDLVKLSGISRTKIYLVYPIQVFHEYKPREPKLKMSQNILYCCTFGRDEQLEVEISLIKYLLGLTSRSFPLAKFSVRPYPGGDLVRLKRSLAEFSSVKVLESEFATDEKYIAAKYNQLNCSDLVINFGSTIILDAAALCKPLVQIGYLPCPGGFDKISDVILKYEHNQRFILSGDHNSVVLSDSEFIERIAQIFAGNFDERYIKQLNSFSRDVNAVSAVNFLNDL
jgi:hypothetical protein